METIRLGRTNLTVSVAGLGTGGKSRIGQGQGKSVNQSIKVVRAALDLGITLIDTSSFYGTEEIVGAAIKGRRDEVVISTKNPMVSGEAFTSGVADYLSARKFKEALEGNLKRLGTEYIDIFHVHGVCAHQYEYCREELVPVLHQLQHEGKIRFAAISERFNIETEHEMLDRALADDVWDVLMVGFNVVNQTATRNVLPKAIEKDVGTLCIYSVRGKLANLESARSLIETAIDAGEIDPADVDPANPLGFLVTQGIAHSLTEACYRYSRHTPGAHVVLTGTGDISHLAENVRAINGPPLPPQIVKRLHEVFGRVTSVTGS